MTAAACFTYDVMPSGAPEVQAASNFRYDALDTKDRRRPSSMSSTRREDAILLGNKRVQLQGTTMDIVRNFTIAGWCIRKHLDYVARFNFQAKTGDDDFDTELEQWVAEISEKENMDLGGRFSREQMFRMAECTAVTQGDTGLSLTRTGHVQGIESDLIRTPPKDQIASGSTWIDGIRVGPGGKGQAYSIYARGKTGGGYDYRTIIPRDFFIHYGFFSRYASEQIRGVSPIVAALNNLRDVYDNVDYALLKSKLNQLFAIAIMRSAEKNGIGSDGPAVPQRGDDDGCEDSEEEESLTSQIDLSGGPMILDLDVGDTIDTIESKSPSSELQAFSRLVVMIALKSLDIPYYFFDEAHTNYAGQRGSWLLYKRSAMERQEHGLDARKQWLKFRLVLAILSKRITLPQGMTIEHVLRHCFFIPLGMPWWNPADEVEADQEAVASGFASPINIVKEHNSGSGDIYQNIRDIVAVQKFMKAESIRELGEPMYLRFGRTVITPAELEAKKAKRAERRKKVTGEGKAA